MVLVRKTFFIIKIIHLCFSLMQHGQDVNNESCRINGNTQTVFFARFKKKVFLTLFCTLPHTMTNTSWIKKRLRASAHTFDVARVARSQDITFLGLVNMASSHILLFK